MRHDLTALICLLLTTAFHPRDLLAEPLIRQPPKSCRISEDFQFKVAGKRFCQFDGKIDGKTIRYFRMRGRKGPLVIIHRSMLNDELPVGVEEAFAARLAKQGFHSLILEHIVDIYDLRRPPSEMDVFFSGSRQLTRAALDRAELWPEVKASAFYALGSSLGGINGFVAFADEPRIRKIVTAVAGGDLPQIFATTRQRFLAQYRNHWMNKLGLRTALEYETYLRTFSSIDPLHVAHTRRSEDIMMIIATNDSTVPTANQLLLHEALGRPRRKTIQGGHRKGGASPLWMVREVARFFRAH